jgi:glycosyltransferase involved in cell wall biosynthesis
MSLCNNPLRIGVAALTRFHMFDLARQMKRLGQHTTLFTGYPRWKVDSDLREISRTRSLRVVRWRISAHLPYGTRTNFWVNRAFCDFGKWLGITIARANLDLLDALDGVGLEAGRAMREQGKIWVCNRGSAHILRQKQILEQEHAIWKQPMPRTYFDPWIVERCLAEYEGAHAIAVPSRFVKNSFVDLGFRSDSIFVCPYGVDLSMFRPQRKEDSRFRVLFVGAQSIRKGIGYLFEALRPLVRANLVELWLLGSTTEDGRNILKRNAELFLHKGVQQRDRLSWFYSQGSVLVVPSVEEGLALVQAQAMACGLPVISTSNTGAEDLFTDGVEGFIVPPRDPVALRDRVQTLLDDPWRLQQMRQAALRRVQALGGWDTYGERCLEMYHQLRTARENRLSTVAS